MEPLLAMLCETEYTSGEQLCKRLAMTRAAIWKRMEKLREEGYAIQAAGKRGYTLVNKPDCLLPGYIQGGLSTRWAGRGDILWARQMDSTNVQLAAMAAAGAKKGSLAVCEWQSQGKGRLGRSWDAAEGENLLHSLLLRPALPVEQAPLCTLAAAVAMAGAVEEVVPGLRVGIKWPNDLILEGRKCAGILSEMRADMDGIHWIVMGVGVNVNQSAFPEALRDKATSLRMEKEKRDGTKALVDRCTLLRAYLRRMENAVEALEKHGLQGIAAEYRARSVTLGSRVRVVGLQEAFEGVAEELDETGALWVREEQGERRRVFSGDVSVRGVMGYV